MDSILVIIVLSLAMASVLNIILTKFSISHIIGYIITGTVVSNIFDFNGSENLHSLNLIGEFGIVFLMFTIGLEMSFAKLDKMKKLIFINGFVQVAFSSIIIFVIALYLANLGAIPSIVIALSFSLSSTAIVLPYLKKSKDIVTPYGERSVAILVFQDLAVIPILLLMSFLSNNELSMADVLLKTFLYASGIIIFMFTLGKKLITWLLHFSSKARMEELFLSSVFTIVLGASLIAHEMGFTYSLGAFIAGMIIAETKFHLKVESDISSYKDLLLGAFFFSIGTKIDFIYFISNLHWVLGTLILVMMIKAIVIYVLMRKQANKSNSIKSAIALCQVGEFSFAIFAMALNQNIITEGLGSFLILITVLSMILTPFMVNNIYKLAAIFVVEYFEADKIDSINTSKHTIVCGFDTLGRIVAKELTKREVSFFIISDNLTHVLLARKRGFNAYFGHLDKLPVLESLNVEQTNSIIITVNTLKNKQIICESVLDYYPEANLVVKVNTLAEKEALSELNIKSFVHAEQETATLLVKQS
ncbi:MAG: cation:proton antiporter [Colwellia sp.]|nr:cation:proton antiporter [Colwellia sp.]